jgi:hypothetical protein
MEHPLITNIKKMTGDPYSFRYLNCIFDWRGKYHTLIAVRDCIPILLGEGWSEFIYGDRVRLWYAKRPDGEIVGMDVPTMRWLAIQAVYNREKERYAKFQKELDTTVNL